jgi:hypothetical protein
MRGINVATPDPSRSQKCFDTAAALFRLVFEQPMPGIG